jgi:hypothetical protein
MLEPLITTEKQKHNLERAEDFRVKLPDQRKQ